MQDSAGDVDMCVFSILILVYWCIGVWILMQAVDRCGSVKCVGMVR